MTHFKSLSLLVFLGLPNPGQACEPPPVYYEPLAIQSDTANAAINAFVRGNAPVVRDVHLGRGTAGSSSLCGGQGYISFDMALPAGAAVTFADIGFEFRVVEGRFFEFALPDGPIRSTLGPNEDFSHLGSWFEGPPSQHKTIDAVVEVFFVSPDGTTGPATRFALFSEVEQPRKPEGDTR